MDPAPIVIFAYNRPTHLQRLLTSINSAQVPAETKVYAFLDAPKNQNESVRVEEAEHILKEWMKMFSKGESVLVKRNKNFGLSRNVISGVDEVFLNHDRVIVLEDDLEVSLDFFVTMNAALEKYHNLPEVASLSGYIYPVNVDGSSDFFLLKRPSSWGWATWKNRWSKVDWEVSDLKEFLRERYRVKGFNAGGADLTPMLIKWKKAMNDSWAVRWAFYHYKTKSYCLFPKYSMVVNTGNDGSSRHSPSTYRFDQKISQNQQLILPEVPVEDTLVAQRLVDFFEPSMLRKVINYFLFKFKPDVR